jgi:metal-dependent amidase/aminoacylase/carboxypeptidase family protein
MVIREGGQATNVIPDKAVMDVEIRSTSSDFVREFSGKVENMAISIGSGYGATVKVRQITPLYESYLHSRSLDSILFNELKKLNINPVNVDDDSQIPSGSTDEANVSMVVPTGHIDMQIGYPGIPGHSDEFREAANPYACSTNLSLAIEATVNAAIRASSHEMKAQILGEFQEAKKK